MPLEANEIKYEFDDNIEQYKARLVVKDYTQVESLDYHETLALVTKLFMVCYRIAIAAAQYQFLYQLDVNNVFHHGDLNLEVYMQLPPYFFEKRRKENNYLQTQQILVWS